MKKYSILTFSLVLAGFAGFAQQEVSNTNKNSEPTMANGMPYSQYKAQQDAATKARIAADAKAIADSKAPATSAAYNTNTHAPAISAPTVKQPEVAAKAVKEPLPAALKGTSLDPDARPVVAAKKAPAVAIPASNSGNTQADAALAAPVENTKTATQAQEAPAAVKPLISMQSIAAANAEPAQAENNNAASPKMPEVKLGASGASPIEEVKPSENAKQPKVPVSGKQGGSN